MSYIASIISYNCSRLIYEPASLIHKKFEYIDIKKNRIVNQSVFFNLIYYQQCLNEIEI